MIVLMLVGMIEQSGANDSGEWPRRLAGWMAVFLLVAAIGQTALIAAIVLIGERIMLHQEKDTDNWFIFQPAVFVKEPRYRPAGTVTYAYLLEGKRYEGTFEWIGDWTEVEDDRDVFAPPLRDFEIAVWSVIPSNSIPLIRGYNPLVKSYLLWLMAIASVAVYLTLCFYGRPRGRGVQTLTADVPVPGRVLPADGCAWEGGRGDSGLGDKAETL